MSPEALPLTFASLYHFVPIELSGPLSELVLKDTHIPLGPKLVLIASATAATNQPSIPPESPPKYTSCSYDIGGPNSHRLFLVLQTLS